MELKELLNPYIEGIEKGIASENWILTVMVALTLPDICNKAGNHMWFGLIHMLRNTA